MRNKKLSRGEPRKSFLLTLCCGFYFFTKGEIDLSLAMIGGN